jgi:hypothetical protein
MFAITSTLGSAVSEQRSQAQAVAQLSFLDLS